MRIQGTAALIDTDEICSFFERRAGATSAEEHLSATSFASMEEVLARHRQEWETAGPLLLESNSPTLSWLDLGCGGAQWLDTLRDHGRQADAYVGVDASPSLLAAAHARYATDPKAHWVRARLDGDLQAVRALERSFNRALIVAVLMYLNDTQCANVLSAGSAMLEPGGLLYVREPVSTDGQRLTLLADPSAALASEYSASYRTVQEYQNLFATLDKIEILRSGTLQSPYFQRHAHTRHQYFLLRKCA